MEVLTLLWQQIGWKDIIDITIVSLLIYQAVLIIHGTRSVQILVGVGLLMILFWFSLSYRLYSLGWILQHFFDSFFIIAIILFQDQIRSALATVGSRNLLGFSQSSEASEMELEEVVEVAGALSRGRVGGLMVFERTNGLSNYIETGTKMNSDIHSDILYAIFQSSSSLHDGAVIIRRGKIAAAGCFLPLSKNVEVDRSLGTRHRAALGVSEVTDAVVVVVSEENGAITMAYAGEFYPCDGEKHLRQYLKQLWSSSGLELNSTKTRLEDLKL
jgi:diadenylate cyclase